MKFYGFQEMGGGFRWGCKWQIKFGVVSVGEFVYIGPRVQILYPTVIGDLSMIAAEVNFIGNDHGYKHIGVPIFITPPSKKPTNKITTIESEVWIGQRATILHGIKISRGVVVAAGAIVTSDVPEYSIVAGVPAKVINNRFSPEEKMQHCQLLYG